LDAGAFAEWQTQSLTFLTNVLGAGHIYAKSFEKDVGDAFPSCVKVGKGILSAVREDLASGYLVNVRTLVAAEVLPDFVEMAQHLLETGYKDLAASLAGAVLGDGLRRIASNSGVKLKARDDLSSLNAGAPTRISTTDSSRRRSTFGPVFGITPITEFAGYTEQEVADMVNEVTDFLATHLK
jgi:hypothetical protein